MKNRGLWEVLERIRVLYTNKDGHSYIRVGFRELDSQKKQKNIQMIAQNIIQKIMFMEQHLENYREKHSENKIRRIKFTELHSQKHLQNYNQRITIRELH